MSNTARTDEIDEVMSSVRQLVSKGDKVACSTDADAPQPLVLTQDYRVDSEVPDMDASHNENVLVLDPAKRAERAGLEATIAELEAAVTSEPSEEKADSAEPPTGDELTESAFQTLDEPAELEDGTGSAEEEVTNLLADEDADDDAELAAFVQEHIGVDEEMLRDMVAEIVREELGGVLGEKITRNVRKLVRREINRVLASRGMD